MEFLLVPLTFVATVCLNAGAIPPHAEKKQVVTEPQSIVPNKTDVAQSTSEPIDLNSATPEQILKLPGIGPKRASAIIELRKQKPFKSVHDLRRIKGIGKKIIMRLAPFVVVKPPQELQK
jgi:competence ComEA-like helix-hairpin-helix protein